MANDKPGSGSGEALICVGGSEEALVGSVGLNRPWAAETRCSASEMLGSASLQRRKAVEMRDLPGVLR